MASSNRQGSGGRVSRKLAWVRWALWSRFGYLRWWKCGGWRERFWFYAASTAYWWGEVADGRVNLDGE